MDAVLGVAPLWQSHDQHRDELETAVLLHQRELDQKRRHHEEEVSVATKLHTQTIQVHRQLHAAEMLLHTSVARKDAVRDEFQIWSQSSQTIIIVNALVIGAVFGMTYRFALPDSTPQVACAFFALGLASSILCLAASTFMALRLQYRFVCYSIERPHAVYSCGSTHPTFPSYYRCHCRSLEMLSVRVLYLGTTLTVASSMLLMTCTFYYDFGHAAPGIAYCVIAFLGVGFLWIATVVGGSDPRPIEVE